MNVPEFAIVGHPNEGKSSVVSTLAEDDSVRVSALPGETIACQTFPVVIDGRDVIRFIDTPGFQNPVRTRDWMLEYQAKGRDEGVMLRIFRENHMEDADFRDDCELLGPIAAGAGVIYVADGSRPLRNVDRAEMEVLRLTGRPRMAVLNCKDSDTAYIEEWKSEFRKNFNAIRLFNAHRATYAERIELLETLKSIDQDWGPTLETVIEAFRRDWDRRNRQTIRLLRDMFVRVIGHSVSRNVGKGTDRDAEERTRERLREVYNQDIAAFEKETHEKIRRLFKHNIFHYDLPPNSILREHLFDEKTWQFLGLSRGQMVAAAFATGAAVGAAIDVAAHGITFGVFTAISGLTSAGLAALKGSDLLSGTKVGGLSLSGDKLRVGPVSDPQMLFVLLDRALIYYSHVINWAHGRRDYPKPNAASSAKMGFTSHWDEATRKRCLRFFKEVRSGDAVKVERAQRDMEILLEEIMGRISVSDRRYGLVMLS